MWCIEFEKNVSICLSTFHISDHFKTFTWAYNLYYISTLLPKNANSKYAVTIEHLKDFTVRGRYVTPSSEDPISGQTDLLV